MHYQLIKPINKQYTTLEQILTNRGIPREEIEHYINTTDDDINSPLLLGEENLQKAVKYLKDAIQNNKPCVVLVDCDVDGYTSSAILLNYLYKLFPTWVSTKVTWIHHEAKDHGLSDIIHLIQPNTLVICPDSASNDYKEQQQLFERSCQVIVMDHHKVDGSVYPQTALINNQCCDYPNKQLSGAGIVYQFCRYFDSLLNVNYANNYLDLCALGNTADMQSLRSIETKHLINKGFQNIQNPFIYAMWEKNKFKLGDTITSWGAAFYIAPFVNAITRSGTQEEKEIVFQSMLEFKANNWIPSTKRGYKLGDIEQVVDQAIRICTNVKNRQTKAEKEGIELLEKMIEEKDLLNNKVLLFLLEPGKIERGIAGLVANKMMSKYQRPCCVLTYTNNISSESYQGSARGCDIVGVTDFKSICEATEEIEYAAGHVSAFGLSLPQTSIPAFIEKTNEALADMSDEAIYYVDYVYNNYEVDGNQILDIAGMDSLWGKDIDESKVAIEGLKVTSDMVTLMSPEKSPTLKITLPNGISIIKFGSSYDEYSQFIVDGYKEVNLICKCARNEWLGRVSPQLKLIDYEIVGQSKYIF